MWNLWPGFLNEKMCSSGFFFSDAAGVDQVSKVRRPKAEIRRKSELRGSKSRSAAVLGRKGRNCCAGTGNCHRIRTPKAEFQVAALLNPPVLRSSATAEGGQPSTLNLFSAWYFAALVLFALGLMSKPMLVTLPCVLLLLDILAVRPVPASRSRFKVQGSRFKVSSTLNPQPSTPPGKASLLCPVCRFQRSDLHRPGPRGRVFIGADAEPWGMLATQQSHTSTT